MHGRPERPIRNALICIQKCIFALNDPFFYMITEKVYWEGGKNAKSGLNITLNNSINKVFDRQVEISVKSGLIFQG